MAVLLDSNVLIALTVEDHVHHAAARRWLSATRERLATCPITQGALLRLLIREGMAASAAREVLAGVTRQDRHDFWPDEISFAEVDLTGVVGHRQVTDAYLAHLARTRDGRLATFDGGLVSLHEVAELIPF